MKRLSFILLTVLTSLSFTACNDDQALPNGYVVQTQEASKTIVLKGAAGPQQGYNTLIPDPFSPFMSPCRKTAYHSWQEHTLTST